MRQFRLKIDGKPAFLCFWLDDKSESEDIKLRPTLTLAPGDAHNNQHDDVFTILCVFSIKILLACWTLVTPEMMQNTLLIDDASSRTIFGFELHNKMSENGQKRGPNAAKISAPKQKI